MFACYILNKHTHSKAKSIAIIGRSLGFSEHPVSKKEKTVTGTRLHRMGEESLPAIHSTEDSYPEYIQQEINKH